MELAVPPESLRIGMGPFEDSAQFLQSGRDTLELAQQLITLPTSTCTLDVGCGCGRVALAFTSYLASDGQYAGFDVDAACLDWCVKHIQARDQRFRFTHLDVQSPTHNPTGTLMAETVTFPYASEVFDSAFVSSVFTHMFEAGIERYVLELQRVLRPGGQGVLSVFLMNAASQDAIEQDRTLFTFMDPVEAHCWTLDTSDPLEAVAVDEAWFMGVLDRHGLAVTQVRYGDWRTHRSLQIQHDWLAVRRSEGDGAA